MMGPIAKTILMRMDGLMTCDFTSFSTVFQSYQDDERLVTKGCVQWNPFTVEKISPQACNEGSQHMLSLRNKKIRKNIFELSLISVFLRL